MSSKLLDLQRHRPGNQPAVPRPRRRWWSRLIIPLAILLGSVGLLLSTAWHYFIPLTMVQVEPAIARTLGISAPASTVVQAAGWLEADPYRVHVTALTSGIAHEILVLEGDRVERGQVVARLDARDAELAVQKAQATMALRQAQAADAAARQEAAQASWDHPFRLEQQVAVAGADRREAAARVTELKAHIDEQKILLAQAERDAQRAEQLVEGNAASAREGEQARSMAQAAAAALQALQGSLEGALERVDRTRADELAATRELALRIADRREVGMAKAALDHARAGVELASAELAEAQLQLDRMAVTAPSDGVVMARHKEPGDKVMLDMDGARSATIVSLYDPARLQVRVDIPLADAGQIVVGQRCEIMTEILPNTTFTGQVVRILHAADVQKNTLQVKVAIEAPHPALRPEMLCRVRFLAMEKPADEGASTAYVFVPRAALQDGQVWLSRTLHGHFARAEPRPVTTLLEHGEWVAVDGIRAGTRVIVNPPRGLKPGERVQLPREEESP